MNDNTKSRSGQNSETEGFTITLALVDALPVLLFSASSILISYRFQSLLFTIGVVCIILAGMGKVIWKLIMALSKRNIKWLNWQFRYMMLSGFMIILLSVVIKWKAIHITAVVNQLLQFPSVILFLIGSISIVILGMLGKKLDGSSRSNWIEQITNTIAQGAFFIGLLLLH